MDVVFPKSKAFAIRMVNLYSYLAKTKNEYVMSKQLLRSGTSIGANIAEAQYAISKADFIAKQQIALKECAESLYWIEILHETNFLSVEEFESIYADCEELKKLLISILKSSKGMKSELRVKSEKWRVAIRLYKFTLFPPNFSLFPLNS